MSPRHRPVPCASHHLERGAFSRHAWLLLGVSLVLAVFATALLGRPGSQHTQVEAADQNFNISLDQTISNGVPSAGAGNIEAIGDRDIYSFTAGPNQEVFFDTISAPFGIRWTLERPDLSDIFTDSIMSNDQGLRLLNQAGTYTLTVHSGGTTSGTYSFIIRSVPAAQSFSLALDQTVSNGLINGSSHP